MEHIIIIGTVIIVCALFSYWKRLGEREEECASSVESNYSALAGADNTSEKSDDVESENRSSGTSQISTSISRRKQHPRLTPDNIDFLYEDEIFVFGSNMAGYHNGGASATAYEKFGAIWGKGEGLQGKSYAIPTVEGGVETIKPYVDKFLAFACKHQELYFLVTRIGCGTAGFRTEDIAPLFEGAQDMKNVSLPAEFLFVLSKLQEFPYISRSALLRITQQGQVRTLADIAMALNEKFKFTNMEDFINAFQETLSKYIERGTISKDVVSAIQYTIMQNEKSLFRKRYLDLGKLEKVMDSLDKWKLKSTLDAIYSRREKIKILRIVSLLNDVMHYTTADDLCEDMLLVLTQDKSSGQYNVMNDIFIWNPGWNYPLMFFIKGVRGMWDELQDNGHLSNKLLEQKIFTEHENKVAKLGFKKVLEEDYINDGPCHPEVFFPKKTGTGPVYVKDDYYHDHCSGEPLYVKSCGEGKGPRAHNTLYEFRLILPILERECQNGTYKIVEYNNREYYIPNYCMSKPVFDSRHGLVWFDDMSYEKERFLLKVYNL